MQKYEKKIQKIKELLGKLKNYSASPCTPVMFLACRAFTFPNSVGGDSGPVVGNLQ